MIETLFVTDTDSESPFFLDSSLWLAGDKVFAPLIGEIPELEGATLFLEALIGFSSDSAIQGVISQLPQLSGEAIGRTFTVTDTSFLPLESLAHDESEGVYATLQHLTGLSYDTKALVNSELQALESFSFDQGGRNVNYVLCDFIPLTGVSVCLTGEIGGVESEFRPLTSLSVYRDFASAVGYLFLFGEAVGSGEDQGYVYVNLQPLESISSDYALGIANSELSPLISVSYETIREGSDIWWLLESLDFSSRLGFSWLSLLRDTARFTPRPSARADFHATLSTTLRLNDPLRFTLSLLLDEQFDLEDTALDLARRITVAREITRFLTNTNANLTLPLTTKENLALKDQLRYIVSILFNETLDFTDSSLAGRFLDALARDQLTLTPFTNSNLEISLALVELLGFDALAFFATRGYAIESMGFVDSLFTSVVSLLRSQEGLELSDSIESAMVVVRGAKDSLSFTESISSSLIASLLLEERFAFVSKLPLGEEVYSAWVLNADTLGCTRYEQFPMLAITEHFGRFFGLTETGLYELTGDTDDGEPIEAAIETGDLNFAIHQDKNIPRAYLYIQADGIMRLRTITSKRGCREEAWYAVEVMSGEDTQARIIRLARGVRGNTWQFRLENVQGCDFDLRGAEVLPVVLSRRGAKH